MRIERNAIIIVSILFSLLLVANGLFQLFAPTAENSIINHHENPSFFQWWHFILIPSGMLGIAICSFFTKLPIYKDHFMLKTVNILSIIGFAVMIVDNYKQMIVDHTLAHDFIKSSQYTQETILIAWDSLTQLSPSGLLSIAFMFLWVLTVSLYTFKEFKKISVLGILSSVFGFGLVLSAAFDIDAIKMICVMGSLPLIPIYYLLLGLKVLK
ncbi:hypothetical protein [Bacillus sp. FJAT-27245]|uniref:hypothetical protein n=1 Tax=Bacillus sp. FJAT-27245 TaxID=1684144 RepID=UPI0006A7E273|nr:hypothetical protein [Bacillus sp. FJAT-27245]